MALVNYSEIFRISKNFTFRNGSSITPERIRDFKRCDSTNEKMLLAELSKNGWKRWRYFPETFSVGWDESEQMPLAPRSQAIFLATFETIQFAPRAKPSPFFTDAAHLELTRRDADGKSIQIEFGAGESVIHSEASRHEKTVPNRELPRMVNERPNA